ncbi:MAG: DinB family protein [Dehalococcoidia bacterium]|nr:DinB family protein [Dehalococcoidia bacterium]
MASADELRQQIADARNAFRQALQGVDGKWEQSPGGEEWSPKQIAQHAIGGEVYFANFVSTAMLGKPGEADRSEIASSADALTRHEAAAALADRAFKYVEDSDLTKPAENIPGSTDQNVEAAMRGAAAHLREHTEQLRSFLG